MQPTSNIRGATFGTTIAVIGAGTTSTLTTTTTRISAIKGKAFSKAAITNSATPTTDYITSAAFVPVTTSKASMFVYGFDAAGTLRCMQGPVVSLDAAGGMPVNPPFPDVPDEVDAFGYLLIKAGSTASAAGWIQGTSNMAAVTGITYTFVDVLCMPDRPQSS